MSYPELELFFYRRGEAEFSVVLRQSEPGNEVDRRIDADVVRIDTARFSAPEVRGDPVAYGLELGKALFANKTFAGTFDTFSALAESLGKPLRLRLCTDQRSRDALQRLRWELLRRPDPASPDDPARSEWLMVQPNLWFSRHLFSGDMRPVRLRPQGDLTVLVAVASPTDTDRWRPGGQRLTVVDVAGELETARLGLGGMARRELVPNDQGRVTLSRLLEALRSEPDVLYLVCHGALIDGEPRLMLEKDDGTADMVSGAKLVDELAGLRTLPRLVVLISCQSAGSEKDGSGEAEGTPVLSAIGPRLAEAGVAAVLAMHGNLRIDTARRFLPAFFSELQRSSQIDAAVTLGRAAVKDAPDAAAPTLFTRLVEGRVWYTGGISVEGSDEAFAWKELVNQISTGKCVPILGSGLIEPFVGSTRELANELAAANGYPLALSGREDLPQVVQYLKTITNDYTMRLDVAQKMAGTISRRWPELNLPSPASEDPAADLRGRLVSSWRAYKQNRPFEPHHYLARLRQIRTYITTNPDNLLMEALAEAGRTPRTTLCRWDTEVDVPFHAISQIGEASSLVPTGDAPAVYQLFGSLSDPDSILLSEDDYFQFLTAVTRRQAQKKDSRRDDDLADDLLRGTLASSALVFLGFRLTDWDFRALLRVLLDQNGGSNRSRFTHIAVQVDPEDGTHDEAARARNYISGLFRELVATRRRGKIAVYWGGVEDFLKDLDHQWNAL
jgi:hypothetical protein